MRDYITKLKLKIDRQREKVHERERDGNGRVFVFMITIKKRHCITQQEKGKDFKSNKINSKKMYS